MDFWISPRRDGRDRWTGLDLCFPSVRDEKICRGVRQHRYRRWIGEQINNEWGFIRLVFNVEINVRIENTEEWENISENDPYRRAVGYVMIISYTYIYRIQTAYVVVAKFLFFFRISIFVYLKLHGSKEGKRVGFFFLHFYYNQPNTRERERKEHIENELQQ